MPKRVIAPERRAVLCALEPNGRLINTFADNRRRLGTRELAAENDSERWPVDTFKPRFSNPTLRLEACLTWRRFAG